MIILAQCSKDEGQKSNGFAARIEPTESEKFRQQQQVWQEQRCHGSVFDVGRCNR